MAISDADQKELIKALVAVRQSGAVNMLHKSGVARVALELGYVDEAVLLSSKSLRGREYMALLERMPAR